MDDPLAAATPLGDWLGSVGLAHLAPVMRAHDIAEDVIASLTEQDMAQLGLSMGERKRLMRAIARLGDAQLAHTELRQLTIMFCDLVDATAMSARLPPEAWREVVLAYQQTALAVITRQGGSIAQYLGDGLLVYFGYPCAQEDAAVRAVQAGLELGRAVAGLRIALPQHAGVSPSLRTRIGLHTGMVVIGAIGAGERREQLALGEAPHIAARLQELALPDTLLITEATRRIAAGSFRYEDMGVQALKGAPSPMQLWRVLGSSGVPSRFEARIGGGVSPMVGRAQELGLLLDRWQAAVQGQGQVVLVAGEAGMGKSRLLTALREQGGPHAGQQTVLCQCSALRSDCAFHPLAEAAARALQLTPDVPAALWLDRIEAFVCARHGLSARDAALLAAMLGLPGDGCHELAPGSPHQRQQDTIAMVGALMAAQARQGPLLLCFEDAHWADPASLAALEHIAHAVKDLPVLLVVTHRPGFTPAFKHLAHVTALKMPGLRRSEVAALVSQLMGGQRLTAEMVQHIQHRTDGVPLFVEELTRALLAQGAPSQTELAALLPATLRDALMARLDRHPGARELAQVGAAIGREFSHRLLQAVCEHGGDAVRLAQGLAALEAAGLIQRYDMAPAHGDGPTYVFRHALMQDAAYDTLPPSRKQRLHARILAALQQGHAQGMQAQPALLARHALAAGRIELALSLWRQASERALERQALHEAAAHLQAALRALALLPASAARDRDELALHTTLGLVHVLGKGWAAAEVQQAYRHASRLVAAAASAEDAIRPLWGLCMHHLMRGSVLQAQVIGQRMQVVARQSGCARARRMVDLTHMLLHGQAGALDQVEVSWQRALSEPTEAEPAHRSLCAVDLRLMAAVQRLHTQWIMGQIDDVDAAYAVIEQQAIDRAQPCSLAWVSIWGAMIYLHADRPDALLPRLHRGQQIAQAHGFAWLAALATFAMGWCQTRIDDLQEGTAMMERGLAAYKATGAGLMLPCCLALLAQALGQAGRHAEAKAALHQAWHSMAQGGERWHEAECQRIHAQLPTQAQAQAPLQAGAPQAELSGVREGLAQAIAIAAAQGAQRWQVRAMQAMAALPQDEIGPCADLAC